MDRHTSHGRHRVVLAVQSSPGFQVIAFACVSDDSVGCVDYKGHKVCVELSNEIVDLVLLVGTFSKDCERGEFGQGTRLLSWRNASG